MDDDGQVSSTRSAPAPPARAGGAALPNRPRSFDPSRVAGLECAAWVAYYQRRWLRLLVAAVGLVRAGLGMSWPRTMRAAWYVLRAIKLWAPLHDNDPRVRRRTCSGSMSWSRSPAASRRIRRNRRASRSSGGASTGWLSRRAGRGDELVDALARLYAFVFGVPEAAVRPAAFHRCQAMEISDQWVAQGSRSDSPLIAWERTVLIRSYKALLAAVGG